MGRCHRCNIGCITATHQLGVLSITPLAPCPGHMHQVHNHKSPLLALSALRCCTTLPNVCSMVCAFAWHITTAAGAKHRHAWPWWGLLSHNWLRSCPSLHKEDFVHRLLRFAGLCPQPAASRTLVDFTTHSTVAHGGGALLLTSRCWGVRLWLLWLWLCDHSSSLVM